MQPEPDHGRREQPGDALGCRGAPTELINIANRIQNGAPPGPSRGRIGRQEGISTLPLHPSSRLRASTFNPPAQRAVHAGLKLPLLERGASLSELRPPPAEHRPGAARQASSRNSAPGRACSSRNHHCPRGGVLQAASRAAPSNPAVGRVRCGERVVQCIAVAHLASPAVAAA